MSLNTVISYPIPPYQNVPIEPQNYRPRRFVISGLTLGQTTLVTATTNMDYVVGQLIRLIIPVGYGAVQLNQQLGYVISIPMSNQVIVSIYSATGVNQFTSSSVTTLPQILAVGDINNGVISSTGPIERFTSIPGAFINISNP